MGGRRDVMLIFVSVEDIDDPLAQAMIEKLGATGWRIEHSPRNPGRGDDPRWNNWYGAGCVDALLRADAFLGIATAGWNGSTWMAHEAETALDQGLQPFLWNPNHFAVPVGMRRFAERRLAHSLAQAIAQLATDMASPPSLLERHLSRLGRFLRRLPGCPEWASVMLAENASPIGPFQNLVLPSVYVDRFNALLQSRSWLNLHAVGVLEGALVVSIEASSEAAPRVTPASVQLSGPESRVTAESGWGLPPRRIA